MASGSLEIKLPDGKVKTVDLSAPQSRLGRSPDVEIPVNDPQVSRVHLLIQAGSDGVSITDEGSANGTFLGETRIPVNELVYIKDGALIRVGQTFITYHEAKIENKIETPTKEMASLAVAGELNPEESEPIEAPTKGRPELAVEEKEISTALEPVETPTKGKPPLPIENELILEEAGPKEEIKEKVEKKPRTVSVAGKPPEIPPRRIDGEEKGRYIQRLELTQSSYLKYLPDIYSSDDFIGRFLLIFETILSPLERSIDKIHHYFDPHLTPPELLPWLASWLGLVLNEDWPEARRRELILAASELYQWRGTRRGLIEFIKLYTGTIPEIKEPGVGLRKVSPDQAYKIEITIKEAGGKKIDPVLLKMIIEAEKPAHVSYTLNIGN